MQKDARPAQMCAASVSLPSPSCVYEGEVDRGDEVPGALLKSTKCNFFGFFPSRVSADGEWAHIAVSFEASPRTRM